MLCPRYSGSVSLNVPTSYGLSAVGNDKPLPFISNFNSAVLIKKERTVSMQWSFGRKSFIIKIHVGKNMIPNY